MADNAALFALFIVIGVAMWSQNGLIDQPGHGLLLSNRTVTVTVRIFHLECNVFCVAFVCIITVDFAFTP